MYCQKDYCRMPCVDHKWKHVPNCIITEYIATHLILRYIIICILASMAPPNNCLIKILSFQLHNYQSPIVRKWSLTIQWVSIISCDDFCNKVSWVSLGTLAVNHTGWVVVENSAGSMYHIFGHYCVQFWVNCFIGNFSWNYGINFTWPYFINKPD